MRPKSWKASDCSLSGTYAGDQRPTPIVEIVLHVPIPGSPQGTRRSIRYEMTTEQARSWAKSPARPRKRLNRLRTPDGRQC